MSSAPYIFSKCLRKMVKYWRRNSIKIVLYLDDGFGMAHGKDESKKDALFVKESLNSAGFLTNEKKYIFSPIKELEWLGIIWNSSEYLLKIPERRIDDMLGALQIGLSDFSSLTARKFAQIVGKIISMTPVIGNISRLMARYSYMCIESRITWDSILNTTFPDLLYDEFLFWLENIININFKKLYFYSKSTAIVFFRCQ